MTCSSSSRTILTYILCCIKLLHALLSSRLAAVDCFCMHNTRRHYIRDDYLFFVDKWWFIGSQVGNKTGVLFVRDGAWRPEHVLSTWVVFSGSHFEGDTGLRVRCQGFSQIILFNVLKTINKNLIDLLRTINLSPLCSLHVLTVFIIFISSKKSDFIVRQ